MRGERGEKEVKKKEKEIDVCLFFKEPTAVLTATNFFEKLPSFTLMVFSNVDLYYFLPKVSFHFFPLISNFLFKKNYKNCIFGITERV